MSEKYEGIDFENWTAACAHLASGMSEEDVLNVLGVNMTQWQSLNKTWTDRLAELMNEDMEAATTYGNIFANPKVGKFSKVKT